MNAPVVARMWRQGNGSRQLAIAFLVFLFTAIVTTLALVASRFGTTEPWAPLGPYPQQEVVSALPASLAAGHVDVVGTKCAEPDTPTTGVVRWVSQIPGGVIVIAAEGSGKAAPTDPEAVKTIEAAGGSFSTDPETGRRCVTRLFENDFPPEVIERTKVWIAEGKQPVWLITATEKPSDGRREGVAATWTTPPFEVTL